MGYNGSGQGGVTSRGSSGVRSWGEGGVATMHLTRPRAVAPLGAGADQDIRAHVTATGGSSSGGGGLNGASSARVEAQGVESEQAAVISSGQRLRRTGRTPFRRITDETLDLIRDSTSITEVISQ